MLRTKCACIDSITNGGVVVGEITEICGESGVGKSQLCMQLAITSQLPPEEGGLGGSSVYIHTEAQFPITRMHQIASTLLPSKSVADILGKVVIRHSCCPYELGQVLTSVDEVIKNHIFAVVPVKLVVVDSICAFFFNRFPPTKDGYEECKLMLKGVGCALRRMAKKYEIAIVVSNGVISSFQRHNRNNFRTSSRIVLPKIAGVFQQNIGCRWLLTRERVTPCAWEHKFHKCTKDSCMGDGHQPSCIFRITEAGLSDGPNVTVVRWN